jgi:hypothetical protein
VSRPGGAAWRPSRACPRLRGDFVGASPKAREGGGLVGRAEGGRNWSSGDRVRLRQASLVSLAACVRRSLGATRRTLQRRSSRWRDGVASCHACVQGRGTTSEAAPVHGHRQTSILLVMLAAIKWPGGWGRTKRLHPSPRIGRDEGDGPSVAFVVVPPPFSRSAATAPRGGRRVSPFPFLVGPACVSR